MKTGDLLEWGGAALVVAAVAVATGALWAPLAAGGVFLIYQAQCWADHPLPRVSVTLPRRGPQAVAAEAPEPVPENVVTPAMFGPSGRPGRA